MDNERKEHLLKAYNQGMGRYILTHGVVNWGLGTALIYRTIMTIQIHGWSFNEILRGILSVYTLYAMLFFGVIGIIFGYFMWKWIERTVKKFPPEPKSKPKGKKKK